MQFIRKYSILIGIAISLLLILKSISLYPGGTMFNEYTTGFDWTQNFFSNLFGERALNGSENPSRLWAYAGMILLPSTYALFFIHMSEKIPDKTVTYILKYGGLANIAFTFLTVTKFHDLMLIISTTFFWTCLIVISVIILKTKLNLFKFCCVVTIITFYYTVYLWATSNWNLLPIMQKVNLISSTLLILALEYFTKKEDFTQIKSRTNKLLLTEQ
jgi:hypothetical protein